MTIDQHAPLIAEREILIESSINKVWNAVSDVQNWPSWQKDVSTVQLFGTLQAGSRFQWKAMGMSITSQLQTVEINKVIGWTGKSIGMQAVHYWYFEKSGSNTKVTSKESLSGWFPRLIKMFQPNFLDDSMKKSLMALKTHVEATD